MAKTTSSTGNPTHTATRNKNCSMNGIADTPKADPADSYHRLPPPAGEPGYPVIRRGRPFLYATSGPILPRGNLHQDDRDSSPELHAEIPESGKTRETSRRGATQSPGPPRKLIIWPADV